MAALNFLADGASRRILFLSLICENLTTIGGANLDEAEVSLLILQKKVLI